MLTSTVVVHLMHGAIEGHFHFFAMIPVVALYEDWVPFGLAVGIVLMHHGLMGTIEPNARGIYYGRLSEMTDTDFQVLTEERGTEF